MSWFSIFNLNSEERRKARENLRTYRLIRSLPEEIQKDIGWPGGERIHRMQQQKGAH